MLKLLNYDEKIHSRKLYEEAFPEDSERFIDYYYTEKIKYNKIVADIERENDAQGSTIPEVKAMLHLNPYRIKFGDTEFEAAYIVAVATALKYRRQGLMRGLLKYAFKLLYKENMPFTFLLPANPAYYEPFGFTFISKYIGTSLKKDIRLSVKPYNNSCLAELADFMNKRLSQISDIYCIRDEEYIKRLIIEIESEDGMIELLMSDDKVLSGYRIFWGIQKRENREFLCSSDCADLVYTDKPYMMGRIIKLDEFVKQISLEDNVSEDCIKVDICIKDDLISENNGSFVWNISKSGSFIKRKENKICDISRNEKCPVFTIDEMAAWLFGYKKPADYYKYEFCKKVKCLKKMYVNEVV